MSQSVSRVRRLVCLALGDHGAGPPRIVKVAGQSPLGGRAMRCGRCGQTLARYVNSMEGRLD